MLVFGVFLVLVGITATAQAALVSAYFSSATLNAVVGSDAATVRTFVNATLVAADLQPETLTPDARAQRQSIVDGQLGALVDRARILHVEIRKVDGTVLYSEDSTAVARQATPSAEFLQAALGTAQARILDADPDPAVGSASSEVMGAALPPVAVLREYLPLIVAGQTVAVVGFWHDATPLLAQLDESRRSVVLLTVTAALIISVLLFLIFRSAQGRLTRQTQQLLESTRRDSLTGLLNHGAVVEYLAAALEGARGTAVPCAVALLDIDNFRLLNDTYGHAAGDGALLGVARALTAALPAGAVAARYGPDEFLVVHVGDDGTALRAGMEQVVTAVSEESLQFEASERLPITLSVGIALAPDHAQAATDLMSVATNTLTDAKAGGGGRVLVANSTAQDIKAEARTGFQVLQGLVLAIDAKDRYTKRHSEDVARYGLFIADRMGLDPQMCRTLHLAGLLHDVGKIGIPDDILRKPGRLTAEEFAIVKQHVALGDAMVRDLPDIETVRAGIRHHHEAWNGKGYLDHLEAEQIPLVARILAVADAYSAMTTTRPYRKALSVEEALRRLGDAAGTQLEERLVRIFIEGIETAADPPMPGVSAPHLLIIPPAAHAQVA
jgi:diguanylate cyclase (GGDEF)-like protein